MMKQTISNSKIKLWFLGQYFLEIIIVAILLMRRLLGTTWQNRPVGAVLIICILLLILIVPGIFLLNSQTKSTKFGSKRLLQFNYYFQTIGQMIVLPTLLNMILSFAPTQQTVFCNLLLVSILVYSLVMYLPIGILALARIQSLVGRLFMSILVALLILNTIFTNQHHFNKFLLALNNSGFIAAISFVILMSVVMQKWGFSLPKFSWTTNGQKNVIVFLIIFSIIVILFNTFGAADSWTQLFTKFDFTIRSTSLQLVLEGAEAGILEEWLCRFVLLYLLLRALRNHLFQLDLAIMGSAALFGLVHFINLAVQSLAATTLQAISAFCLGVFFATVYLYTKAFWWPMLFHAVMDILVFMISGKQTMSNPTNFDWWLLVFTSIIFLGIAGFLMSGQRRFTVKENFPELL